MRGLAVLVVFLLLPTAVAESSDERDRAAEVKGGAFVLLHLSYEGGAVGTRSGTKSENDAEYALTEMNSYDLVWSGDLLLRPTGVAGESSGQLMGEWTARASSSRTWDYRREGYAYDTDSSCEASGVRGPVHADVKATLVGQGLQLHFTGMGTTSMAVPDACRMSQVTKSSGDPPESFSSTGELLRMVPLHHFFTSFHSMPDVTLVVPLDGRAALPASHSSAVPSELQSAGALYCGMADGPDGFPWATGSCSAGGTLTARAWVEPCGYIRREFAERYAALAAVSPPPNGTDEAGIRAWAAPAGEKVRAVMEASRSWQLFGCPGDLLPEPWDAMVRVMRIQRDALIELGRQGKLTPEGVSEAIGAERQLQLMGGSDDSTAINSLLVVSAPAITTGNIEVSVHSPVALHAWSEEGGHVGWNASTNSSETTIAGGTYEGAPGGAQRIVLPAGFYKLTVDELAQSSYVFEVKTNGTPADTEESFLVAATPGRTTATHFALTAGWDGPRLDTFPVRRGAMPAEVTFREEGRPPVGSPGPSAGSVADTPAGESPPRSDAPMPGGVWAFFAIVGAAAVYTARRAR